MVIRTNPRLQAEDKNLRLGGGESRAQANKEDRRAASDKPSSHRDTFYRFTFSAIKNSMLFSVFLIFSSMRFIASLCDSSASTRRKA